MRALSIIIVAKFPPPDLGSQNLDTGLPLLVVIHFCHDLMFLSTCPGNFLLIFDGLESTDHCLVDDVELFDKSFNVEEFEDDEDRRSDAYQDLANRHYA